MSLNSIEQTLSWLLKGYGFDADQITTRGSWVTIFYKHEKFTKQWIEIKIVHQFDETFSANLSYSIVNPNQSSRSRHQHESELNLKIIIPNSIYTRGANIKEKLKYILIRSILMPLFPPKHNQSMCLSKLPNVLHYHIAQYLQFTDVESYFSTSSTVYKLFLHVTDAHSNRFWNILIQRDFPNRRLKSISSGSNFQRMSSNPHAGIAANNSPSTSHATYELYKQYYFGMIGNQMSLSIPPLRRPSGGSFHDLLPLSGTSSPSCSLPSTPRIGEEGGGGGDEIEVRQSNRVWDWYRKHMNHSPFASPGSSPRIGTPTAASSSSNNTRLLRRSISSIQSVFGFGHTTTNTVPTHPHSIGHVHSIRVQPGGDDSMMQHSSILSSMMSSPRESMNASPSLSSHMMMQEEYGDELDQPWESASRIRPSNSSPMLS